MLELRKLPFFIFLIISIAPMLASTILQSREGQILSILSPLSPIQALAVLSETTDSRLSDLTEQFLVNDRETYGVFIKNLKTGETYGYNQNLEFQTASLYKLWVMGATYEKISEGKLTESSSVTGNLEDMDKQLLQSNATSSGEEKHITFNLSSAIEKMITVSDNYAALSLVGKIGRKSVDNFLIEYGFSASSFNSPPRSTPEDVGKFFDKLYYGGIVSPENSIEMMDILKRQKINDRLPRYLPNNVLVAHKTGELDQFKNDAGLVYSPNGDYIIVVLSKTNDPDIAAEKIAKYSEAVYNYFQSL